MNWCSGWWLWGRIGLCTHGSKLKYCWGCHCGLVQARRDNSSNVGGVTAGQARHNSSNVGGVLLRLCGSSPFQPIFQAQVTEQPNSREWPLICIHMYRCVFWFKLSTFFCFLPPVYGVTQPEPCERERRPEQPTDKTEGWVTEGEVWTKRDGTNGSRLWEGMFCQKQLCLS